MNKFQRAISNIKFVARLIELDSLLYSAMISASSARMLSLTQGPAKIALIQRHRGYVDEFNAKKFWFMKRRQYEV